MGGIMYRTENLNKSYADGDGVCYALKDVNLDISKGQMVAIVGESGSGKSTLLNILGAIDSATDGKVIANGKNIAGLSEEQLSTYRSKTVGFVFQAFHVHYFSFLHHGKRLDCLYNPICIRMAILLHRGGRCQQRRP